MSQSKRKRRLVPIAPANMPHPSLHEFACTPPKAKSPAETEPAAASLSAIQAEPPVTEQPLSETEMPVTGPIVAKAESPVEGFPVTQAPATEPIVVEARPPATEPSAVAAPPVTRPSLAEAERDALLRLVPDQVLHIRFKTDGSVVVIDGRSHAQVASYGPAEAANPSGPGTRLLSATQSLCNELGRQARQLMNAFEQTREVQVRDIQIEHDGKTRFYEIRATGCIGAEVLALVRNGQTTLHEIGGSGDGRGELLAVVRDVTGRREAEASIARARDEVARLSEVLQKEASVHAEDEEIMENAFAKLTKLLEDTIGAIQMIVQMKDPPTARHQARVCRLACAISREMGFEKSRVDTIGLAALLHDLGKVLIPNDMLNKPGKLTENELSAVRESAEAEFQILRTIDLFCPIADIVHQHHERLDGSGYPLGLKGEEISPEARIIAVADVVEAMVSERPYRPALSLGAALREIEANRGTLYDPQAVDACIKLFVEGTFQFDDAAIGLVQQNAAATA